MCACIGGLDRAHLHLMSVPEDFGKSFFEEAINKVLYNRKAGIKYIEYNNYKLENLHDINQIYESMKKEIKEDKIKGIGKILKLGDIQNLSVKEWPLITIDHIKEVITFFLIVDLLTLFFDYTIFKHNLEEKCF